MATRRKEVVMTEFLSREQIVKSDDLKVEIVEVPEWGGRVKIRELRAWEREQFEKRIAATGGVGAGQIAKTLGDLRATLVASCLVDDENQRLFSDADVKALNEKAASVIIRLFGICSRLSGISQEVVDAAAGESETIIGAVSS